MKLVSTKVTTAPALNTDVAAKPLSTIKDLINLSHVGRVDTIEENTRKGFTHVGHAVVMGSNQLTF